MTPQIRHIPAALQPVIDKALLAGFGCGFVAGLLLAAVVWWVVR